MVLDDERINKQDWIVVIGQIVGLIYKDFRDY